MPRRIVELEFSADFVKSLPGETSGDKTSREIVGACYATVQPSPVKSPMLAAWSDALGESIGIVKPLGDDELEVANVLAGNRLLAGMKPYSACYGGHQFGHWAGQLGDGRAITLGEFKDQDGQSWELQLKGAGRTPFSRFADGRAVLRSSLREFLCSEAMHGLGISTTRALSLVLTGEDVVRDMFYDGRPAAEPGAITSRLAPSFLRFGNFQILSDRGEHDNLRRLADFAISRHFSHCLNSGQFDYGAWFAEICVRTAKLVVDWQRVGFVHGVMNTDNMSILGLTIDYGPYGWLEGFDPSWTPNTTDASGRRYCYGRQPQIAYWNLQRFGEALIPLMDGSENLGPIKSGLELYAETFKRKFLDAFAKKLGLQCAKDRADEGLITDLLDLLQGVETDMTLFFRRLALVNISKITASTVWGDLSEIYEAFYNLSAVPPAHQQALLGWFRRYAERFRGENVDERVRKERMNRVNPKFVFRNYLAQEAIDELTEGSSTKLNRLLKRSQNPYADELDDDEICGRRPEWARFRPGCSALSCSS